MKKLLPITIFAVILFLSPKAFAQDSSSAAVTNPTAREKLIMQREGKGVKVQSRLEENASRAAQLKTKLQTFRNKIKAEAVQRISDNLNRINKKRTDDMSENLSRMTNILNKLGSNASASAAIATAKEAVTAQSQKDYTVSVTTENKVKTDAKTVRDQLAADLHATRKLVIAAKQSLMEGVRGNGQ